MRASFLCCLFILGAIALTNFCFGQGYDNGGWRNSTNIAGSGINWTSIRVFASVYGDHSGINWQSLGV